MIKFLLEALTQPIEKSAAQPYPKLIAPTLSEAASKHKPPVTHPRWEVNR
ncbi:MAG: hypothetical protein LBR56_04090 [Sporomusaceae bacterium]|nr:hypothetical protein [Sporomusaceae bacterium]